MVKTVKPIYIFFIFLLLVVLDVLANTYDWFWVFWWFDILMHFLGGVLAGAAFFWIFPRFFTSSMSPFIQLFITFILAMGFVALIGVVWEFYELAFHIQGGVIDTMEDLFNDFAGGAVVTLLILLKQKRLLLTSQPSLHD